MKANYIGAHNHYIFPKQEKDPLDWEWMKFGDLGEDEEEEEE
jgi:hypothetical protein